MSGSKFGFGELGLIKLGSIGLGEPQEVLLSSFTFSGTFGDYDFLTPTSRAQTLLVSNRTRGDDRLRVEAHGANTRVPLWGPLEIHQEGLLVGDSYDALVAERDGLLRAILGHLDVPSIINSTGVLTIRFAGWAEEASADVTLDSYEVPLAAGSARTSGYMLQWKSFDPFFMGVSSGDPVYF